jgi:mannose-1-phosphate guanylyltransferase
MQALVLAGGEGTRLRPLTQTVPKPVMPLAGRPFLTFMLDWLRGHGVDDVLLSCGFLAHAVEDVLGEEHEGMRLRYVHEDEPLGTAGPVRLAADEGMLDDRFLVLNGDVLTDMNLTAEIARHEQTGAAGTLALIEVDDVSSFGVVPTNDAGEVLEFREKSPGPAPTNRINAGAYVLERSVVDLIPAGRSVSFELEVFPQLVGNGLYGWDADGYWIDIGTPERYLEATWDLLAGRATSTLPERDETGSLVYEGSLTSGAHIGPQAVLGRHCSVGPDAAIERSVLHDRVVVGSDAVIRESIVGAGARVGEGVRMQDAVIGAGAAIDAGTTLERGARVEPGGVAPDPQGAPGA